MKSFIVKILEKVDKNRYFARRPIIFFRDKCSL